MKVKKLAQKMGPKSVTLTEMRGVLLEWFSLTGKSKAVVRNLQDIIAPSSTKSIGQNTMHYFNKLCPSPARPEWTPSRPGAEAQSVCHLWIGSATFGASGTLPVRRSRAMTPLMWRTWETPLLGLVPTAAKLIVAKEHLMAKSLHYR